MSSKLQWFQDNGLAVHDDKQIKGFFGDYRFLSNFADADVWYEGMFYFSSEAAYQAQKVLRPYQVEVAKMGAKESKKGWMKFPRADKTEDVWNARKFEVMRAVVFDKFYRNRHLRSALLLTGDKYLEETNWWNDTYWGVSPENGGQNNLGKILMATREYFRLQETKA